MYIACSELNLGNGKRVAPGQPVPEALEWPYVTLIAHLNLKLLEWKEEDGQQCRISKWREETAKNAQDVREQIFGGKTKTKIEPVVKTAGPATVNAVGSSHPTVNAVFDCEKCPGKIFKTAKALKTHNTIKHK